VPADFDGKVAIVTGAAGAIGSAVTRLLVDGGADVVATDLAAIAVADGVVALEGDASLAETAERAVRTAVGHFGRLDVLVNNAGHIVYKTILDTSDEEWDRVMAVNVRSMFVHCRATIPIMQEQGGGAIVNVASISGLIGIPALTAYTASKGAVVQLTRQLAVEWAAAGIRVNAVAPGAIDTPFLTDFVSAQDDPEEVAAAIRAEHPLGRWGTAGEVAEAVVFLASDRASFVTGAVLAADGGFTAA
jgi:NAD(P)-dependent dehydrogenase (short-subunit alcohol dehydrogenase family)